MPWDTTATNKTYNSQGDTKANTWDQHPSATVQPRQHGTPKPTVTSHLLPILSSQNTHNHKKTIHYKTIVCNKQHRTTTIATVSKPQHMACSKQWPALLASLVCSRSPTIPNSNYLCHHPCLTTSQVQLTTEQSPRDLTIHRYTFRLSY